MSDSGAPASTSAADDGQRPRRRVRVGERRRVHHDARHQGRRQRTVVRVERHAESDGEERHHLAGCGRRRFDPVGLAQSRRSTRGGRSRPAAAARRGPRWRSPTAPMRSSVAAIGRDEQVVVGRRVRIGPKALDAIEEVVQRRYWVRADRVGLPPSDLDDRGPPPASPRACRASGFSWLTASTRRAPRIRSTTRSGTAPR